jgi:hypothetical protein
MATGLAGPTALLSMQAEIAALEAGGGGGGASLTIQEKDGVPSVSNVTTIKVSDGTLTDDGSGEVTISTGSGAKTGFTPVDIAQCNNMVMFDSATYWGVIFLTESDQTMSLDNCTIFGAFDGSPYPDPADGSVEIVVYNWGTGWNSAGSTKKCTASLATCGYGPNDLSFTPEDGEDLLVEAGEKIMIAIRKISGTLVLAGSQPMADKMFAQSPVAAEPAVPIDFPTLTPDTDPEGEDWQTTESVPGITFWETT